MTDRLTELYRAARAWAAASEAKGMAFRGSAEQWGMAVAAEIKAMNDYEEALEAVRAQQEVK